ncbi:MAG: hypothetical protein JXQ90_00940 [Cyclobacteriaceae bacterium]
MKDKIIWYNPDTSFYEAGTKIELDLLRSMSKNHRDFSIFLELTTTTAQMVDKLLNQLNGVDPVYVSR